MYNEEKFYQIEAFNNQALILCEKREYQKAIETAVNEKLGRTKKLFKYKKNDTVIKKVLLLCR